MVRVGSQRYNVLRITSLVWVVLFSQWSSCPLLVPAGVLWPGRHGMAYDMVVRGALWYLFVLSRFT